MVRRATSPSTDSVQCRYLEGCVSNDSFGAGALVAIEGNVAQPLHRCKHYIACHAGLFGSILHYTMRPEHQVLLASVGAAVRRLREERAFTRRELAQKSG